MYDGAVLSQVINETDARAALTPASSAPASAPVVPTCASAAPSGVSSLSSSSSLWNTDLPADVLRDAGTTVRGYDEPVKTLEQRTHHRPLPHRDSDERPAPCGVTKALPSGTNFTVDGDPDGGEVGVGVGGNCSSLTGHRQSIATQRSLVVGTPSSSSVAPTKDDLSLFEGTVKPHGNGEGQRNRGNEANHNCGARERHTNGLSTSIIVMSPLKPANNADTTVNAAVSPAAPPVFDEAVARTGESVVCSDGCLVGAGASLTNSDKRSCGGPDERNGLKCRGNLDIGRSKFVPVSDEDTVGLEGTPRRRSEAERSVAAKRRRGCILRQMRLVDAEVARIMKSLQSSAPRAGPASVEALQKEKVKLLELRGRYESALQTASEDVLQSRQLLSLSPSSNVEPSHSLTNCRAPPRHGDRLSKGRCRTAVCERPPVVVHSDTVSHEEKTSTSRPLAVRTAVAVADDSETGSITTGTTDSDHDGEQKQRGKSCARQFKGQEQRCDGHMTIVKPVVTRVDPHGSLCRSKGDRRVLKEQKCDGSFNAQRMAAFYLRNGRSRHTVETSAVKTNGVEACTGATVRLRALGACARASFWDCSHEDPWRSRVVGTSLPGSAERKQCKRFSRGTSLGAGAASTCVGRGAGGSNLMCRSSDRQKLVYHLCAPSFPDPARGEMHGSLFDVMNGACAPFEPVASSGSSRGEFVPEVHRASFRQQGSRGCVRGITPATSMPLSSEASESGYCDCTGFCGADIAPPDYHFPRASSYHRRLPRTKLTRLVAPQQVASKGQKWGLRSPSGEVPCPPATLSGGGLMWRELAERSSDDGPYGFTRSAGAGTVGGDFSCAFGGGGTSDDEYRENTLCGMGRFWFDEDVRC